MLVRGGAVTAEAAPQVAARIPAADRLRDPVPALVTSLLVGALAWRAVDQHLPAWTASTTFAAIVAIPVATSARPRWSWPAAAAIAAIAGSFLLRPGLGAFAVACVAAAGFLTQRAPARGVRPVAPIGVAGGGATVAVVQLLATPRALAPSAVLAGAVVAAAFLDLVLRRRPAGAADLAAARTGRRVADWWWSARDAGAPPGDPMRSGRPRLGLAMAPLAVAAALAWSGRPAAAHWLLVVAAVVATACWFAPVLERRLVGAVRTAWNAVVTIGMLLPAHLLVVTPISLLRRIMRRPLLDTSWRDGRPTYWLTTANPGVTPLERMYGDERRWIVDAPTTSATSPSRHRAAGLAIAATVISAVVFVAVRDRGATPEFGGASTPGAIDSAALADAPWAVDANAEMGAVASGLVYTSFTGWSLRDFDGRYVTVKDRVRASYTPPIPAGVEPIEIWFFGGSTMFGFDLQRDDHTIPSEFARLAEREGRPVHVRNYGAPGYVHYQSVVLLSLLLAGGERPDLVVMYDGANDTANAVLSRFAGLNLVGEPSDIQSAVLREAAASLPVVPGMTDDPPSPLVPRPADGPPSVRSTAAAILEVHRQGIELADALSAHYGVSIEQFWQPSIHSKSPLHPGEEERLSELLVDPGSRRGLRRLDAAVRDGLDPRVHDLASALDGTDGPVFTDTVHVNEAGAAAVAAAMLDQVRDRLDG